MFGRGNAQLIIVLHTYQLLVSWQLIMMALCRWSTLASLASPVHNVLHGHHLEWIPWPAGAVVHELIATAELITFTGNVAATDPETFSVPTSASG